MNIQGVGVDLTGQDNYASLDRLPSFMDTEISEGCVHGSAAHIIRDICLRLTFGAEAASFDCDSKAPGRE